MRALRLARLAAEAEGLLLRRQLRRAVGQAILGAVALLFLAGAVAMLHIAAWLRLSPLWGGDLAALAIAGVDIAVAAVVAWLATRPPRDAVMTEAALLRDRAIGEIRAAFGLSSLLRPLVALLVEQILARRNRPKD